MIPIFTTHGDTPPKHLRRAEDRPLALLMIRCAAAEPGSSPVVPERYALEVGAGSGVKLVPTDAGGRHEDLLLLDFGMDKAILVRGDEILHLPRGGGDADLLSRVAAGVPAWQREHLRLRRRLALPDQLHRYWERLSAATAVVEVCEALVEHATLIGGGYASLVFLAGAEGAPLELVRTRRPPVALPDVTLSAAERLYRPELITAAEILEDTGGPFAALAPVFTTLGASMLLHAPIGEHGVLFLVERRRDRGFGAEDWDLLRALASQAATAIDRVHLFDEVVQLSLHDPLTGLANRRQMQVVLEHSFAAAQRGEGLAVVLIDLDGFKEVNDTRGHPAGDRLLCQVADQLRDLSRGEDLVVRYGGDEFVVLLPGASADGARCFVRRIRERLADIVEFTAGIAEFGVGMDRPEHMVQAADRDLYIMKRLRQRWESRGSA